MFDCGSPILGMYVTVQSVSGLNAEMVVNEVDVYDGNCQGDYHHCRKTSHSVKPSALWNHLTICNFFLTFFIF